MSFSSLHIFLQASHLLLDLHIVASHALQFDAAAAAAARGAVWAGGDVDGAAALVEATAAAAATAAALAVVESAAIVDVPSGSERIWLYVRIWFVLERETYCCDIEGHPLVFETFYKKMGSNATTVASTGILRKNARC